MHGQYAVSVDYVGRLPPGESDEAEPPEGRCTRNKDEHLERMRASAPDRPAVGSSDDGKARDRGHRKRCRDSECPAGADERRRWVPPHDLPNVRGCQTPCDKRGEECEACQPSDGGGGNKLCRIGFETLLRPPRNHSTAGSAEQIV